VTLLWPPSGLITNDSGRAVTTEMPRRDPSCATTPPLPRDYPPMPTPLSTADGGRRSDLKPTNKANPLPPKSVAPDLRDRFRCDAQALHEIQTARVRRRTPRRPGLHLMPRLSRRTFRESHKHRRVATTSSVGTWRSQAAASRQKQERGPGPAPVWVTPGLWFLGCCCCCSRDCSQARGRSACPAAGWSCS
jgi:hypothetical protein